MNGPVSNTLGQMLSWSYKEKVDGTIPDNEPFEDTGDDGPDVIRYIWSMRPVFAEPMVSVSMGPLP
jgi:hypothetical protein